MVRNRVEGDDLVRCDWADSSDAMRSYHDEEWGVASHDDGHLFEMLILEGAQAGLSWSTVLNKRHSYRQAFDRFDPARVARYGEEKIVTLLDDPGIIRNKLKVRGTVTNARAFLAVAEEFGSFATYLCLGWTARRSSAGPCAWPTCPPVPSSRIA
jgi:DNA-3-methyladenine glycosylase I